MIKKNLLLALFVLLANFLFATIEKSGTISSNETWSEDTIKVTGDITINNGVTLTINPGVYIEFQGYYGIYVQGRLLSIGSYNNPITYISKDTVLTDVSGGWKGIRFYNTSVVNDTSKIHFCNIKYGNRAINDETYGTLGGAILVYNYDKVIISNSHISRSKCEKSYVSSVGNGILSCDKASPIIVGNLIENNFDDGIGCKYSSPLIINNTIAMNIGYGINFYKSYSKLINCIIAGNKYANIYQNQSTPEISYSNIVGEGLSENGNIDQDPLFLGTGNTPYVLQEGSPSINSGHPNWTIDSVEISNDIAGNERIKFGRIDIGAYEFIKMGPFIMNDSISVYENPVNNTVLDTINSYYYGSDELTYNIISGNIGSAFKIDMLTGILSVNNRKVIDYESNDIFNLEISITDGLNSDTAIYKVNVLDLNEFGLNPFRGDNRTGAVNFVIDSTVYVGLGNNADSVMSNFWEYNLVTDLWAEMATFPGEPRSEAVSFVIDGKAYVGLGRSEYPYTYYKDFYMYDPEVNEWTQIADFGGSARYNAVAFAIDSLGYVGTGKDATEEQKDFWKYDPDLDSWTQITDINGDKRHGASAFVINGKAYVTGGQYFDSYSVQLSDVREYDPTTDTWEEKIYADGMNLSVNDATALVMGDKGFICYGNKSNVVRYDPETNEVINYGDLLGLGDSRFDPIAFVLDSTAYIGLGYYDVMDPYYQNDILDLNHFPFNITLSNDTIEENSNVNTIIGTLSAEDEDSNESFSYSFAIGDGMNDADNSSFIISGNDLQNAEVFDFESQNEYHIVIQVEDPLGATFQKPFIINVKDTNESPTDIELSNTTIDENSPEGTVIGTFSTIDEDNGDTHTYSLAVGDGTNDADNSSFTISGNELQNTGVFNYESQNEYQIYVATEDEGGEIFEKAFVISVNDINESPTDIELSNSTIDENSPEGTVIGILSTIDEDNDDSHSYSLATGDGTNDAGNSSFIISSDSLQNVDVFDFETQGEYYIFIETDDGNGGSFQKAFVITVNDVTEVGIEDLGSKNIKVFPNPTNGIFKLDFSDALLENCEIKIINSSGQIVYENKANDNIVKIDLSGNSKGIYILFLEATDFKGVEKLILK